MRIAVFVAAGLVVFTSFLHAQSDDDDEDEADYFPLVPTGNSLRLGLRYVGGPKVAFHDVGTVPATVAIVAPGTMGVHTYNDGSVSPDERVDSSGHPLNEGLTNTWTVDFPTQVTSSGDIAYHTYSATPLPDEQTIKAKNSLAEGWALEMSHRLGKIGKKVDVSLVAGFTFSSFNSKRSSYVQSELATLTDVYSLYGQAPPTSFPSTQTTSATQPVYDSNAQAVLTSSGQAKTTSADSSVLLSQQPISSTTSYSKATVWGQWQIKGAYYGFRLGPSFELPVTERLKLTLRVGGAGLLVASNYTANEVIEVDNVSAPLADVETKTHSVLLPAWYADLGGEYWLTERTGFYVDATYQGSEAFNQNLGGRTATIDLSSASGIMSGLTLRF